MKVGTSIKRYKVEEAWKDYSVTLEVDHDILTPELAKMHIDFWSGAESFRGDENGSDVRAAIRLFGVGVMCRILEMGGGCFGDNHAAASYSREMQEEEGWAGSSESLFGKVGIRVCSASVDGVGFDDVELKEVCLDGKSV